MKKVTDHLGCITGLDMTSVSRMRLQRFFFFLFPKLQNLTKLVNIHFTVIKLQMMCSNYRLAESKFIVEYCTFYD